MTRKLLKGISIVFILVVVSLSAYFGLLVYQVQALIEAKPLSECGATLAKRSVPLTLVSAVISQEDHGFLSHKGINWREVRQAAIANFNLGRVVYGASTIDMQVASLCYFKDKKLNRWKEKLLEIISVVILNRRYSKSELLRAYLTIAPLAKNVRGFEKASQYYFNKRLIELSYDEEWSLVLTLRSLDSLNPRKTAITQKLSKRIGKQLLSAKWRQAQTLKWNSTKLLLMSFVRNKEFNNKLNTRKIR